MRIRFTTPEAADPRREGGMNLPPQQARRVALRSRWYFVAILALSPGLILAAYVLHDWLWLESAGFVFFEETRLAAFESGTVTAIHIANGIDVVAGAPLLQIDSPEIRSELAALQAASGFGQSSRAELVMLRRQIDAARERLSTFRAEVSTLTALQRAGAATRGEILGALSRVGAVESELATLERERARFEDLEAAAGAVPPDRAVRMAVLSTRLGQLDVRSPFTGTVDELAVSLGHTVTRGQELLVLRHGDPWIVAFMYGRELPLAEGDEVEIALPDKTKIRGLVLAQAPSTLRLPSELSRSFEQRTARIQILIAPQDLPPSARVHRLPVTVRVPRFRS